MEDFENYIKTRLDWTREQKEQHKENPYWVGQYRATLAILKTYIELRESK